MIWAVPVTQGQLNPEPDSTLGLSSTKMVSAGSWSCQDTAGDLLEGREHFLPSLGETTASSAPVFEWAQKSQRLMSVHLAPEGVQAAETVTIPSP